MPQQDKNVIDSDVAEVSDQEAFGIGSELLNIEKQIISIFHENMSPDYFDIQSLHSQYVKNLQRNVYIYTINDEKVHSLSDSSDIPQDPNVVGVGLTGLCTRPQLEEVFNHYCFSVDDILNDTALTESNFPVSFGKSLVIHQDYQDQGIGSQIMASAMPWAYSHPPSIGIVWAKESLNTHSKMESLAEKFGGESVVEYDSMWRDGWRCVECGVDKKCNCGSIVYILGL